MFRYWQAQGRFDRIFTGSVAALHAAHLPDTEVIHGDGTTTAAKKGGDNLGRCSAPGSCSSAPRQNRSPSAPIIVLSASSSASLSVEMPRSTFPRRLCK